MGCCHCKHSERRTVPPAVRSKPRRYGSSPDTNKLIPGSRSSLHRTDSFMSAEKRKNVLRIGSWNMKCFGTEKANIPEVLEAVCLAILNSLVDVIEFQEIGSGDALRKVCEELNHPHLKAVKAWRGKRRKWKCRISESTGRMFQGVEYNAFLWNDAHQVEILNSGVLGGNPVTDEERFVRRPFIGYLKVDQWMFVLVCVHLKAQGLDGSDIHQLKIELNLLVPLTQAILDQGHQNIVLAGDFNMDASDEGFSHLRNRGFSNLLPNGIPTNISSNNLRGTKQYDNLWINQHMARRFRGAWGVVRDGLLLQDETVSDHCLVWADFAL